MDPLTGVDDENLNGLRSRIRALPSAERILAMNGKEIDEWRAISERLMFDIDQAKSPRTKAHALKHRIQKGIPPRMQPVLGRWVDRMMARQGEKACRFPTTD